MHATFTSYGAVSVFSGPPADNPLVGITDSQIIETSAGPMLIMATRGDGWVTAFDLGDTSGEVTEAGTWAIDPTYLNLETTNIAVHETAPDQFEIFLAGLNDEDLVSISFAPDGTNAPFGAMADRSAQGLNADDITTLTLWDGTSNGMIALASGGVAQVTFQSGGAMDYRDVPLSASHTGAVASDIITTQHNGTAIAVVSFGESDMLSLFQANANGDLIHQADLINNNGLWVNEPGAMTFATGMDGDLYVVLASSGTSSLSVLEVAANGQQMRVVDHLTDTLDTRFEGASHVTTITMNGVNYVLAAGADDGISLFALLGEGRLQHVETIAGSAGSPLQGITGLTATQTPDGARIFVTTQAAPFVVEYTIVIDSAGIVHMAEETGGTLEGQSNNDILVGAAGDDSLNGHAGDDILSDGDGLDVMEGGAGADLFILTKDEHRDVITDFDITEDQIDLSALSLIGGLNNLIVTSQSWGAVLTFFGNELEVHSADGTALGSNHFTHDNIIIGNRMGVDESLYDMALYDNVASTVMVLPPTLLPGSAPAQLNRAAPPNMTLSTDGTVTYGTHGSDQIVANGADNIIAALSGNDTIAAGAGNDQVSGDGGADVLHGQGGNDVLFGGGGFDTITGGDGDDYLFGEEHADTLSGNNGDDHLIGGSGYDWLYGGSGNDSLWSGDTADRLFGGDGDDYMDAGSNFGITVDGLWGGNGNDVMFGSAGYDLLLGGDGDDYMDGGHQADNIYGEDGRDQLFGDKGLDRLFGGADDDLLSGGDGNDGHFGGDGNDTAWGGEGDDRFFGGSGNDTLLGENGADTLYGGSGFDVLVGGQGDDILAGNFNADRFVFTQDHGHDLVLDFDANNTLERVDFALIENIVTYADVLNSMEQIGDDVVITTGDNSSVRLQNVDIDLLDESDFLF